MKIKISIERAWLLVNHELKHFESAQISGDQHAAWRSAARHMWNGPEGKRFFQSMLRLGTVQSYVRPVLMQSNDRWP
jgi:hypothetical protein